MWLRPPRSPVFLEKYTSNELPLKKILTTEDRAKRFCTSLDVTVPVAVTLTQSTDPLRLVSCISALTSRPAFDAHSTTVASSELDTAGATGESHCVVSYSWSAGVSVGTVSYRIEKDLPCVMHSPAIRRAHSLRIPVTTILLPFSADTVIGKSRAPAFFCRQVMTSFVRGSIVCCCRDSPHAPVTEAYSQNPMLVHTPAPAVGTNPRARRSY